MHIRTPLLAASLALLISACAGTAQNTGTDNATREAAIRAAIASPDRPAKDLEQDPKRKPAEVLLFSGVAPGQKIVDMFSAGGWYAELLARVTGPTGQVYMQNPPSVMERTSGNASAERLAGNRLPNVVAWNKPLNDMELPAGYFDGAMLNLVFHDFYTISKDVDDVLVDLNKSLKKGAWVVVVDHAAPDGTGNTFATDPRGQHRIEEQFTKATFARAGFVLESESDVLRNPADDRMKPFFAPDMKNVLTDKFVLRFRKP
jgi:predicted methyltransferase